MFIVWCGFMSLKIFFIPIIVLVLCCFVWQFYKYSRSEEKYVIIGASAAGVSAADQLIKNNCGNVVIISQEYATPYNKCDLDSIIDGSKSLRDIAILPDSITTNNLALGKKVIKIDRVKKLVYCQDGATFEYTKLLLATGAVPRKVSFINASSTQGFFTFNSYHDAINIKSHCEENNAHKVVIVGAGFTGLELAQALYENGMQCSIVATSDHILAACLNEPAAHIIEKAMQKYHVALYKNNSIASLESANNKLVRTILSNGKRLDTDVCVWAGGLVANSKLAADAGLKLQEDNSILVSHTMQTSDPAIYAAGDVAAVPNLSTGALMRSSKWGAAKEQGRVAATNMCGRDRSYSGLMPSVSSSFFGYKVVAAGIAFDKEAQTYAQSYEKNFDDRYCQIFYKDTALIGFVVVATNTYKPLIALMREAFTEGNLQKAIDAFTKF